VDIHTRQFDASDEPAVKSVVDEAVSAYNRLDIFFANAGIASGRVFWDEDTDGFMKMMKTNTLSVFLAAKYACKAMQVTSDAKPYPCGTYE
jgi:NAD(P)-dependent dehydrogenase (short-subunit alcohol dehydrogenase family)